jgi:polyisoprenoid-binding protein YceI
MTTLGLFRTLLFASLCALQAQPLSAEVTSYTIAPAENTRFALEVFKTRLMSGKVHLFLFHKYQGSLAYDAEAPERSSVKLEIESGSLECTDTWVSAKDLPKIVKMAREDMLAVDKYPRMVFASSVVRVKGSGEFETEGSLTIRGLARPAWVLVKVRSGDNRELILEGRATVKLDDYGLKPPSAALGMVGTKSEMEVSFVLRAKPEI